MEASGISASIMKDDGGGMLPSLQNAEGVQLIVAENQKEKAMKYFKRNLFDSDKKHLRKFHVPAPELWSY